MKPMNVKWIYQIQLLILILLFQNCSTYEAQSFNEYTSKSVIDYNFVDQKLFSVKCLQCHNNQMAGGGVYFSSYEELMGSEVLVPFESHNSLLVQTFADKDKTHWGAEVTDDELSLMARWIDLGAVSSEEGVTSY